MKQFLETICIRDGIPYHLGWHQRRVSATMKYFFPAHTHSWDLAACLDIPPNFHSALVRCRILYNLHHFSTHFFQYTPKSIKTLKVVKMNPQLDYRYKYDDRAFIETMYDQREDCDDILISKNGLITDSSIANIAFRKNERWYTPSLPLLAGTTWKRLVTSRMIIPKPIRIDDVNKFDSFKIFNAMIRFEEFQESPIHNIR